MGVVGYPPETPSLLRHQKPRHLQEPVPPRHASPWPHHRVRPHDSEPGTGDSRGASRGFDQAKQRVGGLRTPTLFEVRPDP